MGLTDSQLCSVDFTALVHVPKHEHGKCETFPEAKAGGRFRWVSARDIRNTQMDPSFREIVSDTEDSLPQ